VGHLEYKIKIDDKLYHAINDNAKRASDGNVEAIEIIQTSLKNFCFLFSNYYGVTSGINFEFIDYIPDESPAFGGQNAVNSE
jgi:hypothetical protein